MKSNHKQVMSVIPPEIVIRCVRTKGPAKPPKQNGPLYQTATRD